jgi:hypothetical protein
LILYEFIKSEIEILHRRDLVSVLNKIAKKDLRDLLGKGWLTHDGMWFYNTCRELGIEKANVLNKAAIRSLAPIEIERVKKILGLGGQKIDRFDEIHDFMVAALEMILPGSVFEKFLFRASEEDTLHWEWASGECFAYKGMKRIGIIDDYRCGVIYRIECWFEALGIKYSIDPKINKCIMHEKGTCSGEIKVHFSG